MTRKRWFWVAVALQVLVLLGMVASHAYTLATGSPIVLKTAPVDPWDYFMGEHVVLRYEISRLDTAHVAVSGGPFKRDQTVWVTLRKGDPYWTAVSVSAKRPAAAGGGEIAVRALVNYVGEMSVPGGPRQNVVDVRYGIEQFYVPEGEGPKLEQQRTKISVEAKVDSFGRAGLSRVFVDGKEITWN